MKWVSVLFALACLTGPAWAQVKLVQQSTSEVSTARADVVVFTVQSERDGELRVELLSGDGDVVRRLAVPDAKAGEHRFSWDGKDDAGQPVPDEAYTARAVLESAAGRVIDDPRTRSGGEVVSGIEPVLTPNGDIVYGLDAPARVLIRVGVKGGAMLRSLLVWKPRPAGRNLQRWNGFDEGGLVDLRNDRLAMLVTAFKLPAFSVLTTGQPDKDYRSYRLARGWSERPDASAKEADAQPAERNGVRIARQYYMARYKDREPRISVQLADRDGAPLKSGQPLPAAVRVTVDLDPEDRWLLQETLYEVAFFVDGDFVSEEENGYVPIAWIWNTERLDPGRHLLTVNLTGFTGRIGTRTLQLTR